MFNALPKPDSAHCTTIGTVQSVAAAFLVLCSLGSASAGDWEVQAGGRSAALAPGGEGKPGFTSLAPQATGIFFTNVIPPERHLTNQILLNGSGVTAGDVDGDGWCDLFFCGLGGRSALYRNLGHWKFEDVTRASGLALEHLDATGAAFCDLDGDGDLDLVINTLGQGTHIFFNDGRGHFSRDLGVPVLNQGKAGTSLALADLDGDGWLDLYVANYRLSTIRDQLPPRFTVATVNGEPQVTACNGLSITNPEAADHFVFRYRRMPNGGVSLLYDEQGEPDALFHNLGQGRLAPVSFTNGLFLDEQGRPLERAPFDWGLSVMIRDLNGDGSPDLYVCNDFVSPDRIWINDGRGRFRALPTHGLRHTSLSTMALDVADINRDGHDEIFTADMLSREHWRRLVQRNEPNPNMPLFADVTGRPQYPRNCLQLARGDGTYAEIAQLAGLEASEWTWASMFLDVDLDGYEDLLVVNGYERDYMNMDANRRIQEMRQRGGRALTAADIPRLNRLYPRLVTPHAAFRNLGDLRFADVSAAWGFNIEAVAQGMCAADLDNDGDLDLVINNLNSVATILRNETSAPRVAVRLKGRPPNTRGIGARIILLGGAVPMQSQEMICGGRFQSSDDAMRVFAAGTLTNRMTLKVTWRSGARSLLSDVQGNRIYELDEAAAESPPALSPDAARAGPAPLFRDDSVQLDHTHAQAPFNDFDKQPLLPKALSLAGPGVAWFDLDGDGRDDLIIAGGRGSRMAVFQNRASGRFTRLAGGALEASLERSQTSVLGCLGADGSTLLLAGLSSLEDGPTNASVAQQFSRTPGAPGWEASAENAFPASVASTGPLALADIDGDGNLELFVGGRCLPGRWPEAAPSLLLRRREGRWVVDDQNSAVLAKAGLVNGALFVDLDNDGAPDLVLACEWGPLRLFHNDHGKFAAWEWGLTFPAKPALPSLPTALSQLTGWWNGVAAGDFDGDGRLDLVASNWGRNTKYERYRSRPLRVLYGDFNADGSVAVMESCFDQELNKHVPILSVWTLSRGMPWLLAKYPNFESFSRVSVEEALGERLGAAHSLEANWLDSTLFLNRGDHFEVRSLPLEAQLVPAFALCVADFDGDGQEDVFLSQNFFGVPADTSRYDAGRGLLLLGDGRGGFAAMPGQESGLLIYGEQRGAAVCDYDGDGRADLVVAQAGAGTKLYHNEKARPGLRVRLVGPPGNPHGIGAVLRLKSGTRLGPAREIHAGSGYWSQDSAVPVLCGEEAASELWIRWPGGAQTLSALPHPAAEISVDSLGTIRKLR